MSNELMITATVNLAKGLYSDQLTRTVQVTVGDNYGGDAGDAVVLDENEVDLDFGDVGADGFAFLQCIGGEAGHYVRFGPKSGGVMVPIGELHHSANGGEFAIIPLAIGVTIRARGVVAVGTPIVKLHFRVWTR